MSVHQKVQVPAATPTTTSDWEGISIESFTQMLIKENFPKEVTDYFEAKRAEIKNSVSIKLLISFLTADELMKHGVKSYQDCLLLFDFLDSLRNKAIMESKCKAESNLKIFNDPIHGHIQLHPACQMIVDTPEFQRLRDIKQLGTVYYVYPGAAHNRFEHSLGVCHLAGLFAKALRETQPLLGITNTDILCVQIAGLCMNLGHGPFSRVYVSKFLPAVKEKKYRKPSAKMFDHLLDVNKLKDKIKAYGLIEKDFDFIKEQIEGPETTGSTAWPYRGRPKEKAYLYEIVINRRNGIDVHKWDYMARDCHHLGIKNNFDPSRYMKFARVIEMEGEMQICIRDKEISNLYNKFYTRYTVNKFAYNHKVTCGIELMIVEALVLANNCIRIPGENGRMCSIYECHEDMTALTRLTDYILSMISSWKEEDETTHRDDMLKAKRILGRINRRDLYTCAYETQPIKHQDLKIGDDIDPDEKTIEKQIYDKIDDEEFIAAFFTQLEENKRNEENKKKIKEIKKERQLIVKKISLDFGMKEENPVERLNVYSKRDLNNASHLTVKPSTILGPVNYKEIMVRVYSKDKSSLKLRVIDKAARELLKKKEDDSRTTPAST